MNLPLLILRPTDGAQKTALAAEGHGMTAVVDPLFRIEPISWTPPSPDQYDAILFSSANGINMAGMALSRYLTLPALAVGETTALAAADAGFQVTLVGDGGVQSLIDRIANNQLGRILRLTGHNYTSVVSDRYIDMISVYHSVEIGLGQRALQTLNTGCIVLLHSTRAARVLETELDKTVMDRTKNHIVAISSNVAEAVGGGWQSIHIADQPTDEALLSTAARLCLD